MPLPSKSEVQKLDIAYWGQPFVQIEAKSSGTTSLDLAYLGQPFVSAVGLDIYVNVNGTWKKASAAYANVGGTWKTITQTAANVSGTWRS
jgi:hypothetical protein